MFGNTLKLSEKVTEFFLPKLWEPCSILLAEVVSQIIRFI